VGEAEEDRVISTETARFTFSAT